MILADIRSYLEQRGQASLADIALYVDADPDAVRGMLDVWIRKGKVQRQQATASCGTSCSSCDSSSTEIYLWSSAATIPVALPGHCTATGGLQDG